MNGKVDIKHSNGVALIMVLWVIAVLSVVVLEFCFTMRTEVNIARSFKEEFQCYAMAQGGIQRAVADLIYQRDPRVQQLRRTLQPEEIPEEKKEWMTDGRPCLIHFDKGTCEVKIMSEAGKVNLNTVSESALRKMIGNLGLEGEVRDIVVDSILDWRDADDFHRLNGAENDYYQSLKEPYDCKNGPFDSIEELLLVRGVTPDLFYGRKKEGGGQSEGIGLKDIFSIYAIGEQIDLNSASIPVLRAVLGIPKEICELIVKAREEKRFEHQQDLLQRVPEIAPLMREIGRFILYRSITPYYTIESRGKGKDKGSVRGVKAIVKIDMGAEKGYKIIQWVDLLI